ncbi:MAG: extensin family protein, partial [Hyphomicrobiaceae bacterium]
SYSCRNAYGRKRTNLSEHGRANAIDIRSFTTAEAKEVTVLNDWGPTGWEIRAQIVATNKAAAEKAAAERLAAEKAAKALQVAKTPAVAPAGNGPTQSAPQQPGGTSIGAIVQEVPGIASRLPGAAVNEEGRKGFGLIRPSQLGGPKVAGEKSATAKPLSVPVTDVASQSRRAQFLRAAHDTACKIFGTTLGPETNLAHKNHFHVDMAERSRGNFCE